MMQMLPKVTMRMCNRCCKVFRKEALIKLRFNTKTHWLCEECFEKADL